MAYSAGLFNFKEFYNEFLLIFYWFGLQLNFYIHCHLTKNITFSYSRQLWTFHFQLNTKQQRDNLKRLQEHSQAFISLRAWYFP